MDGECGERERERERETEGEEIKIERKCLLTWKQNMAGAGAVPCVTAGAVENLLNPLISLIPLDTCIP